MCFHRVAERFAPFAHEHGELAPDRGHGLGIQPVGAVTEREHVVVARMRQPVLVDSDSAGLTG